MKLLFDIGNSSINWAQHDGQTYVEQGRFDYQESELIEKLEQYLPTTTAMEALLVASVVNDERNQVITNWLSDRWQITPWYAHVDSVFAGLTNSYAEPKQMGVDRWLAMISAWTSYQSALCVVDCGTALTIDLVAADGKHVGGFILPGLHLMQAGLLQHTDRIHATVMTEGTMEPANNTQSAITDGACLAMVGAIERAFADFQSSCSETVQGVITGGNAARVIDFLQYAFELKHTLVLDGLLTRYDAMT